MRINTQSTPRVIHPAISLADFTARYGIFIVLLLMVVVLAILTPNNLLQVMLQASINAIIAVGMTFVITSGGIDLSVGSIVALCGVLTVMLMRDTQVSTVIALIFSIGVGLVCDLFNGILITRLNLPPFIATLGTIGIFVDWRWSSAKDDLFINLSGRFCNLSPPASTSEQSLFQQRSSLPGWSPCYAHSSAIGGNEETRVIASKLSESVKSFFEPQRTRRTQRNKNRLSFLRELCVLCGK